MTRSLLPARTREAVRLRFEEGRPQEDVAREMGITRPTLRKLEREALEGFVALLRTHGYETKLDPPRRGRPPSGALGLLIALLRGTP